MNGYGDLNLTGNSCAVVGATGGLGRQIVRTLAGAHMRLFVHGHDNQQSLNDLLAIGGVERGELVDLRSTRDVEHLADEIVRWSSGSLNALVYAAGLNPTAAPTRDVDIDDWDETMSVNLRGAFLILKHLLPSLANARGRVVLISSIFGIQSPAGRVAYSASKHGLTALVQCIAKEEGGSIHINGLAPGPAWGRNVRRIFAEHARERDLEIEDYVKLRTERIPMRRFLDPVELANVTLFLCSPMSTYINGQVITISGGASE